MYISYFFLRAPHVTDMRTYCIDLICMCMYVHAHFLTEIIEQDNDFRSVLYLGQVCSEDWQKKLPN